jgi:hypothetical protein
MMYYVISTSEDGDVSLESMSRETLLERLKENYWGDYPIHKLEPGIGVGLQDSAGIYIIAGESVVPQPKQVVTEWDI